MDLHDFTFEFHLYACVECILMKGLKTLWTMNFLQNPSKLRLLKTTGPTVTTCTLTKFIFQIFYEHLVAAVSRKTSSPTPSLLFTMSNCQPSCARTLYCTISHSLTKYFKINTKHEKRTTIKC